jgi:hypothetical protein
MPEVDPYHRARTSGLRWAAVAGGAFLIRLITFDWLPPEVLKPLDSLLFEPAFWLSVVASVSRLNFAKGWRARSEDRTEVDHA